jgi:hypothetical protein
VLASLQQLHLKLVAWLVRQLEPVRELEWELVPGLQLVRV